MRRFRGWSSSLGLMVGVVVLVLFAIGPRVTQAAGCTVGNGYASIQAAVNDGNCSTITVPPGTYTENVTINRSVTINGASALTTIVDGNRTGTVFHITGGTVSISNVTIQHGSGFQLGSGAGAFTEGGGIENAGTLMLNNSTVKDNSVDFYGGGINNLATVVLVNTTLSGNSAREGAGGGIYNRGGTLTMTNTTFSGNSANEGGGITIDTGPVTITNSTFSGNSSQYGGSIENFGTLTLNNTIIANSPGGDCKGIATTSAHNNLIDDASNACGLTNGVNGNIIGQNPQLGPLQVNAPGTTATFALLSSSPAIDAGSANGCPATDQRGVTRPQQAACDIGAYESPFMKPTATATASSTATQTATATQTNTPTATASSTSTATTTPTATNTATATATATETNTPTNTATETNTPTDTATAISTSTSTTTPTDTATATNTSTPTTTSTPSATPFVAPTCFGQTATIYVRNGKIVGGKDNGKTYSGKLNGTSSADVIVGTDGKDTINGSDKNDLICGLGGDDTIHGNDGDDKIDGGSGNDTLYGDDGADTLIGGEGNDRLFGAAKPDTLTGGAGADYFNGGSNTDTATDYNAAQGDTKESIP